VWGCSVGQSKKLAARFHPALHEARAEGPTAGAYEEWPILRRRIGAGGHVVGNGGAHRGQHRKLALLAPLARDHQDLARRPLAAADTERLGYPQAAAIQQRENRDISLALPVIPLQAADGINCADGVVDGERLWHTRRQLG